MTTVREFENAQHYQFVSSDVEVDEVKANLPPNVWEFGRQFDSFFVWQRDGEYVSVWGMFGIVPYLDNSLFKVI